MRDEVLLGPEREPPYRRVQAVGTDHDIEPAGLRLPERHLDAGIVLTQRGDRFLVEEVGVLACDGNQDGREVAARDLDGVPAGLRRYPADLPPIAVDRGQPARRCAITIASITARW